MNAKILLFLMVATAGVGYAIYQLALQEKQTVASAERVYPDLVEQINEVTQVRIQLPEQSITLQRQAQQWQLLEKNGYPADASKVRTLLLGLAQLNIIEAKTRMTARYAKLGVESPNTEGANSSLLQLENAKGDTLAALIIGKRRTSGTSPEYYVRQDKNPQAWLVASNLEVGSQSQDWLDKALISIEESRIRQVEVRQENGDMLRIYRDSSTQTDYQIADLPADATPESAYTINSIASNLAKISLEDVQTSKALENAKAGWQAELGTFDGLLLQVASFSLPAEEKEQSQEWLRISARYEASLVLAAEPKVEEEEDAPATKLRSAEAVQKEIQEINAKLGNWAYTLPAYRLSGINKTKDALISKKESEAPAAEASASGPASPIFNLLDPSVLNEVPSVLPVEATPALVEEASVQVPVLEEAPTPAVVPVLEETPTPVVVPVLEEAPTPVVVPVLEEAPTPVVMPTPEEALIPATVSEEAPAEESHQAQP